MPENETALYALVAIAVVAILGIGIAAASLATDESVGRMMGGGFGGGMMNGGTTGTTSASTPGPLEWTLLVVSAAFLGLATVLLFRSRRGPRESAAPTASVPAATPAAVVDAPRSPPLATAAAPETPAVAAAPPPAPPAVRGPVPETALVKFLNEDERRMYLEIRGHGGEMLQRDLVALGIFSKAKVTRVLDKLEAKGIVVREAHGMTNRVRLVGGVAR